MVLLRKIVRQKKPHNVYETYGECPPDMWEVEARREDISTWKRICSELNAEVCPKLGDALVTFAWGQRPNIVCTYELSKIRTKDQISEYLSVWGKDRDFRELIAPVIAKQVTENCPDGVDGTPHSRCSKLIEISPLGDALRDWAHADPSAANRVVREYCKETGNPDCACLERDIDPLFWYMSHRPVLRRIDPLLWYFPCRLCSSYLTLDGRLEKPGPIDPRVCKRVIIAANEIANVFANPEEIIERAEEITGCVCEFKALPNRRKKNIRALISRTPVPEKSELLEGLLPLTEYKKEYDAPPTPGQRPRGIRRLFLGGGKRKANQHSGLKGLRRLRHTGSPTTKQKGGLLAVVIIVIIVIFAIFLIFLIANQSPSTEGENSGAAKKSTIYYQ